MAAASQTGAIPFVIAFAYKDFAQTSSKRTATCKECGVKINDAGSTTSNFLRHLRTHKNRSVGLYGKITLPLAN